ncbi:MAG: hypothetical protein N2747_11115, partial [Chitinophagaceae bacterium]|nr:hypothetical protein [Chitinophagaceae bacterium]
MKQKIIITALPDGINNKNNACKVSVAVSLQVESSSKTNPRLSDFPDYLNWPDVLKKAEWTVLADGVKISAKVVSAAIDSALWKNLFTPSIKVKPYTPEPLEELPILSFPVKHIVDFVKKAVNAAGKSYSNSLPDTKFYFDNTAFRQISDFDIQGYPKKGREEVRPKQILVEKRLHSRLTERLRQNKFIPFKSQPDPSIDFAQAKYFHGVYGKKIRNSAPTLSPPDFEFHDILSVISNYPQLLKRLGLILDMEFSPPATINTLRIIPTGLTFNTSTAIVCPATECIKTATGFYARPLPDSIIDKGYLKVNTDAFTVYQLDADGAALKYTQQIDGLILKAARQILHAVNNDIPAKDIQQFGNETKSQEGLPSMRTAGLSIARNGMAEKLFSRLTRSKELFSKLLTAGSTPVSGFSAVNASFILPDEKLFADDIILGFRLDIQPEDKPGQWFSLHRRLNKYSYLNTAGNEVPIPNTEPDEGFLQISAVKEEYEEGAILKVPETIACWEGWSLSVPRPGNALNEPLISDTEVHTDKKKELEKYKTPGTAEFRLNVIPQIVKGSLPMLRFGKKYAVKIRTVDLAGNSVPIQSLPENQNECIRPAVKYMRYEPVDPPFLKPANKMKDGESAEVMVIRSNEGISVQQYEEQNPDKNGPHSADAVRHVFPPKTSVEMATALG